ncbi:hypothetical protein [Sphingomonas phyllosphaerae]|uniref:hypothetical protein n=1 Tax=Sphingomonas phyllosphaerae TaxID=257003 RepID=UPI0003B71ED1|nr:hypothetical protein [Sphingomonas phyllosphaerae]
MEAEVTASGGVILVDLKRPEACCLTLETGEALDLVQKLLEAVVEVGKPLRFDPKIVRSR